MEMVLSRNSKEPVEPIQLLVGEMWNWDIMTHIRVIAYIFEKFLLVNFHFLPISLCVNYVI